jgi:hypothetical protein
MNLRPGRLATVLTLSTLLVVVAACGGSSSGTSSTTDPVTSAAPTTTVDERTWMQRVTEGDCFDEVLVDGELDLDSPPDLVDCSGPHGFEVVASVPFDESVSTLPDDDGLQSFGDESCGPRFESFLGSRWTSLTPLGTGFVVRDEEEWAQLTPPGWSPDGSLVYFAQGSDDTDREIYRTRVDARPELVIDDVDGPGTPTLTADGTRLAHIALTELGEFGVFVRDLETDEVIRIGQNTDRDTSPAWSPDGTRLAFRSRVGGNSDVWVSEDGTLTRLTEDPGFDGDPRWSPDGTEILFTSDRNGNYDIWIMNADGSDQRTLTTHPAADEFPSWSPDGELIAFHTDRHGGKTLWLMRPDGSEQSNLSGGGPIGYPSFAPVPAP